MLANDAEGLQDNVLFYNSGIGKYELKDINISDIINSYPNLYYVQVGVDQRIKNRSSNVIESLKGINVPWIIYKQPYTHWFEDFKRNRINYIEYSFDGNRDIINIYNYNQKNADPRTLDWKYSIECNESNYPALILREVPLPYSLDTEKECKPPCIILPFRKLQVDYLARNSNKNEFIQNMTRGIQDLVEYVHYYQQEKGKFTTEEIRSVYIRVIEEYWEKNNRKDRIQG